MKITESKIREIIQEELGISNDVIVKSNEVIDKIKESLPSDKKEKLENFSISRGIVKYDFLGNNVSMSYQFYNFFDKDYYEFMKRKDDRLRQGWSVMIGEKCFLANVILCGVSGNIDSKSAFETIYHEIEHIYQQIRISAPFNNDSIYIKMRGDMSDKNETRRNVAKFFYACIKSEQEGFVNGLYGYLMSLPTPCMENEYEKSDCYQKYIEMTELYEKIFKNKEGIAVAKEYKLTIDKAKKYMNNFLFRICRCIAKVRADKVKYQNFRY